MLLYITIYQFTFCYIYTQTGSVLITGGLTLPTCIRSLFAICLACEQAELCLGFTSRSLSGYSCLLKMLLKTQGFWLTNVIQCIDIQSQILGQMWKDAVEGEKYNVSECVLCHYCFLVLNSSTPDYGIFLLQSAFSSDKNPVGFISVSI